MSDDPTVAERIVLGAVMCGAIPPPLAPDQFFRPPHAELWRLLVERSSEGVPVTPEAVLYALNDDPIRGIDGPYLHTLVEAVPVAAAAPYYAQIVREAADLRAIHQAAQRMLQATTIGDANNAASHARQTLDALDQRDTATGASVGDRIGDTLARIENGITPGMSTPWPDLDRVLGGLRPGTVTIIAARPGRGKSILGLQIAAHVARKHGPALFHSLEMSGDELMNRLVSSITLVEYKSITGGNVSALEWDRIAAHTGKIATLDLWIEDQATITVPEIAASARRRAREGLSLLVVDYLQLVSPTDRRQPREQQVAEASRMLKLLAKDLGIAVVVLAQLNRQSESRADRKPILADLRESGSIEQDADAVVLLFRDEDTHDENARNLLEAGVAKNRGGPCCTVTLHWDAKHMRVTSSAPSV